MADETNYRPALSHPNPPNYPDAVLTPRRKTITFDSAATPQFIGDENLRFKQIRFEPVAGNSGNIEIQVLNEVGAYETVDTLSPSSDEIDWPVMAPGGAWHGKSFLLKASNDGDKINILYA